MRTDAEIRMDGLSALMEALGPVEAERFVSLLTREPFDYTRWQRDLWIGKTVQEVSAEAAKCRQNRSE
jgi:hypothetical protein